MCGRGRDESDKELQGPSPSPEAKGKAREAYSPEPSQGAGPMDTLISNFWPSRIVTEYIAVVVSPPTSRSRVGAAVGG